MYLILDGSVVQWRGCITPLFDDLLYHALGVLNILEGVFIPGGCIVQWGVCIVPLGRIYCTPAGCIYTAIGGLFV